MTSNTFTWLHTLHILIALWIEIEFFSLAVFLLLAVSFQNRTVRDTLELSYPLFTIGPGNTTLGWTYSNLTCHPSVFIIQGYADRVDIPDNPSLNLTSTSSVLTFPTNITNGSLNWRLLAHDVAGTPCAQESARLYYYLDTNGKIYTFSSSLSIRAWHHKLMQLLLLSPSPPPLMELRCVSLFLWGQDVTTHLWRWCGQRDVTHLGDFATALHLRGNAISSLDASLPHRVTQITPLQSAMAQSALLSSVPL